LTVAGAGVAVITDTIFVCGGYDGANHLVSVESYNVFTGHWSVISNMNIPRCYVGACVLKGKLYVVAGFVLLIYCQGSVVLCRSYNDKLEQRGGSRFAVGRAASGALEEEETHAHSSL